MFLDNLSVSLLRICETEHLSYEQASERCHCSPKHFSNIVRKRSCPSLHVFEHICRGFYKTPNRLLCVAPDELSFRFPMPVTAIRLFPSTAGSPSFPICPRCGRELGYQYPSYCSHCGQCLSWALFKNASIVIRP